MSNMQSKSINHEIRNHLNNISVNAELAKLIIDGNLDKERLRKAIETVLLECKKCSNLLNQNAKDSA